MKPDTITIILTYLIISIWAYRRMGVRFCNRIGVSLYGCNRISVSPLGGERFMKPAVNVGVVTSIFFNRDKPGYPVGGRHLKSVEQGRLGFQSFSSRCVEDSL